MSRFDPFKGMSEAAYHHDPFMNERGAPDYVAAALRAADRGQAPSVHPHDAFENAVTHHIAPETSAAMCFLAKVRVQRLQREERYLPYVALTEGWIDDLE